MADLHNIRNTGVFVGGDNNNSPITMNQAGPDRGMTETEVLHQVNALLAELLTATLQLPTGQAREAAAQSVQLKAEVTAPTRDAGRIQAVLGSLRAAVSTAAPLLEIVKEIADLLTGLR